MKKFKILSLLLLSIFIINTNVYASSVNGIKPSEPNKLMEVENNDYSIFYDNNYNLFHVMINDTNSKSLQDILKTSVISIWTLNTANSVITEDNIGYKTIKFKPLLNEQYYFETETGITGVVTGFNQPIDLSNVSNKKEVFVFKEEISSIGVNNLTISGITPPHELQDEITSVEGIDKNSSSGSELPIMNIPVINTEDNSQWGDSSEFNQPDTEQSVTENQEEGFEVDGTEKDKILPKYYGDYNPWGKELNVNILTYVKRIKITDWLGSIYFKENINLEDINGLRYNYKNQVPLASNVLKTSNLVGQTDQPKSRINQMVIMGSFIGLFLSILLIGVIILLPKFKTKIKSLDERLEDNPMKIKVETEFVDYTNS